MVYSRVLACLGDKVNTQLACRFADLAYDIFEKFQSKENIWRIAYGLYSVVYVCQKPLTECVEPIIEAASIALQQGDTHSAMFAISVADEIRLYAGYPLNSLYSTIKDSIMRMREYGEIYALQFNLVYAQFIENLLSDVSDMCTLDGQHCNESEILRISHQQKHQPLEATLYILKLWAAVIMQTLSKVNPSLKITEVSAICNCPTKRCCVCIVLRSTIVPRMRKEKTTSCHVLSQKVEGICRSVPFQPDASCPFVRG